MDEALEWDPVKDLINRIKHGVSFEAAKKALYRFDGAFYRAEEHDPDIWRSGMEKGAEAL